jgi:hypothetical protein
MQHNAFWVIPHGQHGRENESSEFPSGLDWLSCQKKGTYENVDEKKVYDQ